MKTHRLVLCLPAIALLGVSCQKRTALDSGANDAKLRPEVAAASKAASATPGLGDADIKPAPSPVDYLFAALETVGEQRSGRNGDP